MKNNIYSDIFFSFTNNSLFLFNSIPFFVLYIFNVNCIFIYSNFSIYTFEKGNKNVWIFITCSCESILDP